MAKVCFRGKDYEYAEGTPFLEIAADFQKEFEHPIALALVDNKLTELFKPLKRDCTLDFETLSGHSGHKAYKRSVCLLLIKSFYDVAGRDKLEEIRVEFSIGAGYYCTVKGNLTVDEALLKKVKARMDELSAAELPIGKKRYNKDDAMRIFEENGMADKKRLFRYRRSSYVNLYSLEDFQDYYYGFMLPNTGYIKYYELYPYEGGLIVQMPERKRPLEVPEFTDKPRLFAAMRSAGKWGEMLGCANVGDLNNCISSGSFQHLVLVQEALQESRLGEIADRIRAKGSRFVMIAGPSSSGKTTFSHRLSVQLSARGLNPHPIALDNYFVDRDKTPLDEEGNKNYECLEALNVERFNSDMTGLLKGERVRLPHYDFITGRSEDGPWMELKEGDILVLEGIHGLNDRLSHSLPAESKYKIYLSALTTLNIDEHNRIPTTDGRLLRRMVRDYRTRGASAERTLSMWSSVRRGEDENIFPFQEEADDIFNTALIYELSVLKNYAEPLLFDISKDSPCYQEAVRLLKFLQYFLGVSSEGLPNNSLIREFIGGSVFDV